MRKYVNCYFCSTNEIFFSTNDIFFSTNDIFRDMHVGIEWEWCMISIRSNVNLFVKIFLKYSFFSLKIFSN